MNEDELNEVEKMSWLPNTAHEAHTRMLVDEVRRLRGLIADTCDRNGVLRSHGAERCPWCLTDEAGASYHPDGCPAFNVDGSVK